MQFAIATVQYWTEHGFDTAYWRKSTDGTQAIVHLEYAQTLIPNVTSDSNVIIYVWPSDTLETLLNSSAWAVV